MRHNATITPVNRKKNAFRMEIRKEWLSNYVKKKRQQFQEVVQIQNNQLQNHKSNIQLLLKQLPSSLQKLYDYLKQYNLFSSMIKITQFVQMVDSLRQLKVNQYHTYICILSSMIQQNQENQKIVFQILKTTITPILHQARKLIIDNKTLSIIILSELIRYLLHISNRFDIVSEIQMIMVVDLLDEFMALFQYAKEIQYYQEYINCLTVINNVIITALPEQDKQNIKQTQLISLQQKKLNFLHRMFINKSNIKRIIHNMMRFNKIYPISLYTLKVLVNFTHFANDLTYYYIMFDSQIAPMIGYLINMVSKETQYILIVRLVNNILVTNMQLTQTKIRDIFLEILCKLFFKEPKNQSISKQILSFLVNLVNFIGEEKSCVTYLLINLNVCQIFLQGLKFSDLDNSFLQQIIIAFYPLIQVAPCQMKQKLQQNWRIFEELRDRDQEEGQLLQQFIVTLQQNLKLLKYENHAINEQKKQVNQQIQHQI